MIASSIRPSMTPAENGKPAPVLAPVQAPSKKHVRESDDVEMGNGEGWSVNMLPRSVMMTLGIPICEKACVFKKSKRSRCWLPYMMLRWAGGRSSRYP